MTPRQKELTEHIRFAGKFSQGTMPIAVCTVDKAEKSWAAKWMKGKKGLKMVTLKVGAVVSEHV